MDAMENRLWRVSPFDLPHSWAKLYGSAGFPPPLFLIQERVYPPMVINRGLIRRLKPNMILLVSESADDSYCIILPLPGNGKIKFRGSRGSGNGALILRVRN